MWKTAPHSLSCVLGKIITARCRFATSSKAFIHPTAVLIGQVEVGEDVSVWPGAVLRGDVQKISIGLRSNIQDNAVVHCTGDWHGPHTGSPTRIGSQVTVGHLAMLHGCTIHDNVLVGMNATVLDGAVIPSNTIIGAGSLVPSNKHLQSGGLYVGTPVRRVRDLKPQEIQFIRDNAARYVQLKNAYLERANKGNTSCEPEHVHSK